jgi:hypothetical protein
MVSTPRRAYGIKNRIKKLILLLNKERWTSKSPLAETMPLIIEWIKPEYKQNILGLPIYIDEHFM